MDTKRKEFPGFEVAEDGYWDAPREEDGIRYADRRPIRPVVKTDLGLVTVEELKVVDSTTK